LIRSAILALVLVVLLVLVAPVMLLGMLVGVRDPLIGIGFWAVRLGLRILGIRVSVSGFDRTYPRVPYVFMPNHLSFLDGPLVMDVIPGTPRVILKKSILGIPVLGPAMRHVGFVPVDRKGAQGGKRSIALAASLMRERRYSYLIFPEGTRSLDGRLQPFRRGGFFLALAGGAPIVPVSIRGTYELMPKRQWFARSGRVEVVFHDPVAVEGRTEDDLTNLMEEVRTAILAGLEEKGCRD
jgi:1-acyl-sn-glycerol-3-phosphate acyltransferase